MIYTKSDAMHQMEKHLNVALKAAKTARDMGIPQPQQSAMVDRWIDVLDEMLAEVDDLTLDLLDEEDER